MTMNYEELTTLACLLLARDDINEFIRDHDAPAAQIMSDYREINDITDQEAFDLEEILIGFISQGESAND